MKQRYLVLAALSCAISLLDAKRLTLAGLANKSHTIFTPQERNNWVACVAAGCAALAGGIAHYAENSVQEKSIIAGCAAICGGAAVYFCADTSKNVYKRAVRQLQDHASFLHSLNTHRSGVLHQAKLWYLQSEYPLVSALAQLHSLIPDFNLFVDMMNNHRVISAMSAQERAYYNDVVPVFEEALEVISNAILVIKSDEAYHAEFERYTARMAAQAALESARAQQQSADAQWIRAWNSWPRYCKCK